MSREPSESIGQDRLKLPCIFIPDSCQGPRPGHAFGGNAVEFRCIFIPDGYDGPQPGYPWIEFGRITLDPEPTIGPLEQPARETFSAAAPVAGQPAVGARPTMVVAAPKHGSDEFGAHSPSPGTLGPRRMPAVGELGSYAIPDIAATMALWNWLSDPRAILAAPDAVSTTGPDSRALTDKRHAAMRGSAPGRM